MDSGLRLFLGHLGRNGPQFLDADNHPAFGCSEHIHVGLLSAVPYAIGAIGMLALCHHSDRMLERHGHFFAAVFLAGGTALAVAFASCISAFLIVCLAVLAVGYLSAIALFWTIPSGLPFRTGVAGSIAFISSVGQIGSLIAPALFGYVSDRTGSLTMGASVVAGVLIAGGCAVLSLRLLVRIGSNIVACFSELQEKKSRNMPVIPRRMVSDLCSH